MPPKKKDTQRDPLLPPLEIVKASDRDPYIKLLLMGDSKSGKTYFANSGSFCDLRVLEIDFGTSSDTVLGERGFENVDVVQPRTQQELADLYNWLYDDGGVENYDVVVLDELDSLHKMIMDEIMGKNVNTGKERSLQKLEYDHWHELLRRYQMYIEWFLILPCHVVATAWVKMTYNTVKERDQLTPMLSGQSANWTLGQFSNIGFLVFEEPRTTGPKQYHTEGGYIAHFQPSPRYIAGVRGPSRQERFNEIELVNSNFCDFLAIYEGDN